jgi:hypothetical protein
MVSDEAQVRTKFLFIATLELRSKALVIEEIMFNFFFEKKNQ